jgi:T5SS/PEP-CTERM-associated repeat protein
MLRLVLVVAAAIVAASVGTGSAWADITQSGSVSITASSVLVGGAQSPTPGVGVLIVTPPSTLAASSMSIGNGSTNPPTGSGSVSIAGGAANITSSTVVGATNNGRLEVTQGGVFDTREFVVAGKSSSQATVPVQGDVVVDGAGSRLTVIGPVVGGTGVGSLTVRNGAAVLPAQQATSSAIATIGQLAGSIGSATVDGAGSTWQHLGPLYVGDGGFGELAVTRGGVVATGSAIVGKNTNSTNGEGRATIDGPGSRWSPGSLIIGDRGFGEVRVTNGGTLDVGNLANGGGTTAPVGQALVLGNVAGSFGRLVVSGSDSHLLFDGTMRIGGAGSGELIIEDGAVMSTNFASRSTSVVVGANSSSAAGLAVVRGNQSLWRVGGIRVGTEGAGELQIGPGATVEFAVGAGTNEIATQGRLALDGGVLRGAGSQSSFSVRGLAEGYGAIDADQVHVAGTVRVAAGKKLRILGGVDSTSGATFEVIDGELEIDGGLTLAGTSSAPSTLYVENAVVRVRGLTGFPRNPFFTNAGYVNFLGGDNRLDATLQNSQVVRLLGDSDVLFQRDVLNNGTIATEAGTSMTVLGTYLGRGVSGPGSVRLEREVMPAGTATSPSPMAFGGDVTLGPLTNLVIDVSGGALGQFDRVTVDGVMQLDGSLSLNATTPLAAPTTLSIVSAGELLGQFDAVPELGAAIGLGVRFNGVTYDYARDEVLISLLPPLAGDFTLDGVVDGSDLLTWQAQLGDADPTGELAADGNHDGVVDAADLAMLTQAMNAAEAGPVQFAACATVPEPSAALLAIAAMLPLRRRRA